MQIVIDLDEDIATGIIELTGDAPRNMVRAFQATIADAIKDGKQLPKGHGRLIDESQIHSCGWDYINHHAKTNAPTIIEADNVESEDKEDEEKLSVLDKIKPR